MALINCPDCNAEVSDRAPACIKCGAPLTRVAEPQAPAPAAVTQGTHGECPNCGRVCPFTANQCWDCGTQFGLGMQLEPLGTRRVATPSETPSSDTPRLIKTAKSRGVYIILGLFFGMLGIHNFYAGRLGVGVAQMLVVLILGWFVVGFVIVFIWVLIDLFTVKKDGAGDAFA